MNAHMAKEKSQMVVEFVLPYQSSALGRLAESRVVKCLTPRRRAANMQNEMLPEHRGSCHLPQYCFSGYTPRQLQRHLVASSNISNVILILTSDQMNDTYFWVVRWLRRLLGCLDVPCASFRSLGGPGRSLCVPWEVLVCP